MAKKPPCVVSICGPGIKLRLETDRRTCLELVEVVAMVVHANAAPNQPELMEPSLLSTPTDLSHDDRHAFNHQHAPDALRALYETLCDDLLGDAQLALDEERRRRAEAS